MPERGENVGSTDIPTEFGYWRMPKLRLQVEHISVVPRSRAGVCHPVSRGGRATIFQTAEFERLASHNVQTAPGAPENSPTRSIVGQEFYSFHCKNT